MPDTSKPPEGSTVTPPDSATFARADAAMRSTTHEAELATTSMAGLGKAVKSLEDAFDNFAKAVDKVGLEEATKKFYSIIDGVTGLRKNFNDLTAESKGVEEKISLMSQGIIDAEKTLREYDKLSEKHTDTLKNYREELETVTRLTGDYNKKKAELKDTDNGYIDKLKTANEELSVLEQKLEKANNIKDTEQIKILEANILQRKKALLDIEASLPEAVKEYLSLQEQIAGRTADQINSKIIEQQKQKEINDLKYQQAAANIPLERFEKARLQALEKSKDNMSALVDKMMFGSSKANAFGSAIFGMMEGLDKANSGAGSLVNMLGEGLKGALFEPQVAFNRVANLINDRLIKSTLEFDKALVAVGRSTGGFRKEFESIAFSSGEQSFRNLSQFGVTLEKYGQAYAGLSKSVGGFNNMLESQRKLLVNTAASLETLGVSSDTFGKLVANMMAASGKSADASRQAIEGLAKDAIALGVSISDYTRSFEQAMSKISGYGREATTIFKELNALSVATKGVITSQDLLSISDRFKDFDGAAESVSKLNAILGGTSVNILDMMKADPAEQIMMIKRAATESGLEFDKLNIGYKRLLAEYFGGDIQKAAAFFKSDLQEAEALMNKAAASEAELAKRKEENVAFQDKLNTLLDNMKVSLTPILDMLGYVFKGFQAIVEIPGVPLMITFGLIGGAISLAGASLMRFKAGMLKAAELAKTLGTQFVAEKTKETAAINTEIAALEKEIVETKSLAAARRSVPPITPASAGAPPAPVSPVVPNAATPAPGGGGGGFLAANKGMLTGMGLAIGGMLIGAGAKAAASYVEKQNIIEREQKISEMRRDEITKEAQLLRDMGIIRNEEDNKKIIADLESYAKTTGQQANIPITGGSVEDVLFIASDDGKTIKESYKLSAGDKFLPVGKDNGALQQAFNPKTDQIINEFSDVKSVNMTKNIGGASIAEGDKTSVSTSTTIQDQKFKSPPQSSADLKQSGNTINLVAYLSIDNKTLSLVTDKVSESVTNR